MRYFESECRIGPNSDIEISLYFSESGYIEYFAKNRVIGCVLFGGFAGREQK